MDILSKMSQGKFMFYLQSIEMLRFYTNYNNKDMEQLKNMIWKQLLRIMYSVNSCIHVFS